MPDTAVPGASTNSAPLASLHAGTPSALRRSILVHLRRSGPASPDEIATGLGASRSGVAQQLRALETAGLVSRTAVRHGVGRPRHDYDLTPVAQDLFPATYDELATGLLAAILEVGGERLVDEVFAARRRQAEARLRERLAGAAGRASIADRVREVARAQDELGFLAEAMVTDDELLLVEHNCAVLDVARLSPAACCAELDLFRNVLDAEVTRETHIADGDRCCTYRIVERASRATDG